MNAAVSNQRARTSLVGGQLGICDAIGPLDAKARERVQIRRLSDRKRTARLHADNARQLPASAQGILPAVQHSTGGRRLPGSPKQTMTRTHAECCRWTRLSRDAG